MPFDIDVRDTEPTPTPRYVPVTPAQDAAARALGLSWAEWAERELEDAARRVDERDCTSEAALPCR